jgi:hypothetical protein
MAFDDILEVADQLPPEDLEALIAILERRRLARRRAALAKDVGEARHELEAGQSKPQTPAELMQEILS